MNLKDPILNLEVLDTALFGDRSLLKEIIEMLSEQIPFFKAEMNDIFSTRNGKICKSDGLSDFIHKLKGLSASIGAERAKKQADFVTNYISDSQNFEKTEIYQMTDKILQNLEAAKFEMIQYSKKI